MKQVKVVRVESNMHFAYSEYTETHNIINEMYKYGWEFKGCIPAVIRGNGAIVEVDLVFEKGGDEFE